MRFTRRGLLTGIGGGAVGALGAGGVAFGLDAGSASPSPKTSAAAVDFYRSHQAGIATPLPAYAQVLAFNLLTKGLQTLGRTLTT